MKAGKRIFDLTLALLLCLVLALPFALLLGWVWLRQGRPLFFGSRRMCAPDRSFTLWKLRTKTPGSNDGRATTAQKDSAVTPTGNWLRRTRLDEIPQLWNVLRGEMSFVGPRPPLPRYVARHPTLYARVLRNRPGITGLATLTFHRHEARLMARALHDGAGAEGLYERSCIPRKARLDLIYQRHASLGLDLRLLLLTLSALRGR
ncbi:MAG: sugar transferase [Sulfitobacter sp.]|nr:sugar transferase [Sulfitobacter sp.]